MSDSDLIITERLTDEELDAAEARAKKWLSDAIGSIVVTRDQAIGEEVMAYDVLDLIAELRERRAQDLTPNEIEHLVILRDMVDVNTKACRTRATTAALAVLDKLTRGNR